MRKGASAGVSPHAQRFLGALIFGLWLPALIALYFLSGRLSANRLNPFGLSQFHGAREMPHYGCCAQGLVLPQRHLEGFQALLRDPPYDFPGDMILEGYAEDRGLVKWALEPSVFQHVGFKESSEGQRRTEVWNFGFERQYKVLSFLNIEASALLVVIGEYQLHMPKACTPTYVFAEVFYRDRHIQDS